MGRQLPFGAQLDKDGTRFRVWAAGVRRVEVVLLDESGQEKGSHPLRAEGDGYFSAHVQGVRAGTHYMYRLDGDKMRPDPASRYQPRGVHGPSQVVDPDFPWSDNGEWKGVPLSGLVIYEVHIGTATPGGTFDALIEKLPYLSALGVTAIEIMPVADFPGERNWGYDGVNLFAPARAYGGPLGLKKLVDAAHAHGLAVIQDVVYNHLGPDGNYLRDFSPEYFTSAHHTPWGDAVNFGNREVREFFIANARYWAHEFRMDGLRLDATHAILDNSEPYILEELAARVKADLSGKRHFVVCAEDERNEVRLLTPTERGGMGLDAVWADDFHHQVRSAFAGDNEGYYADYTGSAADLAETLNKGWFYTGQRSQVSGEKRGTDASHIDPARFIYCIQNHDQIGNRATGDRLNHNITPAAYRAASALLLLSPCTPLLFQGQEWAAGTPFLFFTDHNPELGKMITEGRRAEFAHFKGFKGEQVPDPQAEATFLSSKLRWQEREQDDHARTLELYKQLIRLRQSSPIFSGRKRSNFKSAPVGRDALAIRYSGEGSEERGRSSGEMLIVVNLRGRLNLALDANAQTTPPREYRWEVVLSTGEPRFGGETELVETQAQLGKGLLSAPGPAAVVLQAVPAG